MLCYLGRAKQSQPMFVKKRSQKILESLSGLFPDPSCVLHQTPIPNTSTHGYVVSNCYWWTLFFFVNISI